MTRLDARRLEPLMRAQLDAVGVDAASIDHVVGSLLQTSLRGVDSHGLQLFPHYLRAVKAGRINAAPRLAVDRSGRSTAVLDADHAFGHLAGAAAVDLAGDIALETGVGAVCVRQSTHLGAAAYFALRAAERGLLGFAFTNADALVKAFNGKSAVFGTNPICFTAPLEREEPLCLDMATSLVSWNKVRIRRESDEELEEDWAFDANGEPTVDAHAAAALNPIGGYKGFGLGMMVEVLCGLLAGGPVAHEILPMYGAPIEARRSISHFFMVMDVRRFVDPTQFRSRLQELVDSIRALPHSGEPVQVPGDPEKRAFAERSANGIPAPPALLQALLGVSDAFRGAVLP
jgi:ureidoglycolate dehydrogenase (NAD+)